jgi:hypothetical protein
VVGGALYGVIDFSGCRLLQRLCGILLHFFDSRKMEQSLMFCYFEYFCVVRMASLRFGEPVRCGSLVHYFFFNDQSSADN